MKLTLNLNMDNAAFVDTSPGLEAGRILRKLAERLERELTDADSIGTGRLMDVNGNGVGEWRITED